MKQLTKYIETVLDEVFIMAAYLNMSTSQVENYVTTGDKFNNPLRIDRRPSAQLKQTDKLRLVDYAKKEYNGDIYHIVGMTLGLDSNKGANFVTICNTIIADLISNSKTFSTYVPTKLVAKKADEIYAKSFTKIQVDYAKWDNTTFSYWYNIVKPNKELGKLLLIELQRLNIYPIRKFWLNSNNRATRVSHELYPIYAYLLRTTTEGRHYKIYLPGQAIKFYTNASDTFNYLNRYQPTLHAVLTKSIKDAVVLNTIAKYLDLHKKITFIPVNSESANFKAVEIADLRKRYKHLYTFYDWDETGFLNAYTQHIVHGTTSIFITTSEFNPLAKREAEVESLNLSLETQCNRLLTIKDYNNFANKFVIKDNKAKDFTDYAIAYGIDKTLRQFTTYFKALIK